MTLRVMVVGGYGNFGSIVCRHLIAMPGVALVISGRDSHKTLRKVNELHASSGRACESWCGDAMDSTFPSTLQAMGIDTPAARFRGSPMQWHKAASPPE